MFRNLDQSSMRRELELRKERGYNLPPPGEERYLNKNIKKRSHADTSASKRLRCPAIHKPDMPPILRSRSAPKHTPKFTTKPVSKEASRTKDASTSKDAPVSKTPLLDGRPWVIDSIERDSEPPTDTSRQGTRGGRQQVDSTAEDNIDEDDSSIAESDNGSAVEDCDANRCYLCDQVLEGTLHHCNDCSATICSMCMPSAHIYHPDHVIGQPDDEEDQLDHITRRLVEEEDRAERFALSKTAKVKLGNRDRRDSSVRTESICADPPPLVLYYCKLCKERLDVRYECSVCVINLCADCLEFHPSQHLLQEIFCSLDHTPIQSRGVDYDNDHMGSEQNADAQSNQSGQSGQSEKSEKSEKSKHDSTSDWDIDDIPISGNDDRGKPPLPRIRTRRLDRSPSLTTYSN
ncbi:hypothetical protein F4678DRAFT_430476 [Xylaria arbuscula]|nr:hypothetical protein F4678DRAFT_430476 [Xylaria arbuscula]